MKKDDIFIQHAGNVGEKVLKINSKIYKLDGFCEETNTIYEFYGDFWHGNPDIYNKKDINPLCKISYGALYNTTMKREKILRDKGYNIVTIWENEYIKK